MGEIITKSNIVGFSAIASAFLLYWSLLQSGILDFTYYIVIETYSLAWLIIDMFIIIMIGYLMGAVIIGAASPKEAYTTLNDTLAQTGMSVDKAFASQKSAAMEVYADAQKQAQATASKINDYLPNSKNPRVFFLKRKQAKLAKVGLPEPKLLFMDLQKKYMPSAKIFAASTDATSKPKKISAPKPVLASPGFFGWRLNTKAMVSMVASVLVLVFLIYYIVFDNRWEAFL